MEVLHTIKVEGISELDEAKLAILKARVLDLQDQLARATEEIEELRENAVVITRERDELQSRVDAVKRSLGWLG